MTADGDAQDLRGEQQDHSPAEEALATEVSITTAAAPVVAARR
ncbi:hypothetical protein [Lentzea xinjiangensis]|nr:hypothetical protein [Lentzea xinjiangensis]